MSREAAAYHEAGHAVVATAFHIKIDRVRIFEDGHGETDYAKQLPLPEHRIITALAGWAAERQFLGAAPDPATVEHDFVGVLTSLTRMGVAPEQAEAMILLYSDDAIATVGERWSAVQDVAAELLQRDELSGEEVARIIAATGNDAGGENR